MGILERGRERDHSEGGGVTVREGGVIVREGSCEGERGGVIVREDVISLVKDVYRKCTVLMTQEEVQCYIIDLMQNKQNSFVMRQRQDINRV